MSLPHVWCPHGQHGECSLSPALYELKLLDRGFLCDYRAGTIAFAVAEWTASFRLCQSLHSCYSCLVTATCAITDQVISLTQGLRFSDAGNILLCLRVTACMQSMCELHMKRRFLVFHWSAHQVLKCFVRQTILVVISVHATDRRVVRHFLTGKSSRRRRC